ncbi:MAG: hypothetical protein WCD17_04280 [Acinetobacter calcoaceticus]
MVLGHLPYGYRGVFRVSVSTRLELALGCTISYLLYTHSIQKVPIRD